MITENNSSGVNGMFTVHTFLTILVSVLDLQPMT